MIIANIAVSQVINTLQPKLCDGEMLKQIDWAISTLAIEAEKLRINVKPDYQHRTN